MRGGSADYSCKALKQERSLYARLAKEITRASGIDELRAPACGPGCREEGKRTIASQLRTACSSHGARYRRKSAILRDLTSD